MNPTLKTMERQALSPNLRKRSQANRYPSKSLGSLVGLRGLSLGKLSACSPITANGRNDISKRDDQRG